MSDSWEDGEISIVGVGVGLITHPQQPYAFAGNSYVPDMMLLQVGAGSTTLMFSAGQSFKLPGRSKPGHVDLHVGCMVPPEVHGLRKFFRAWTRPAQPDVGATNYEAWLVVYYTMHWRGTGATRWRRIGGARWMPARTEFGAWYPRRGSSAAAIADHTTASRPNETGRRKIMADETVNTRKHARKPKARKFYRIGPDLRVYGPLGFRIENTEALTRGGRVLTPPAGKRGFPPFPEPPRLVVDRKLGRAPRDLEQYDYYWLVSDRTKGVLEAVDPDAVAFVKCATGFAGHTAEEGYWLCDVVRVRDAVDESASRLRIEEERGAKIYNLMGGASIIFQEDIVGTAHLFRMAYLEAAVFCDQQLKDACKAAGLKGLGFRDAANY
ncbi:MAG TPA: DUF1629 domain-containing protein [Xanthobacteraceae bacterium]|nr:DUF1629 domain-containing protein [Xanthobacteraceae bacterium]